MKTVFIGVVAIARECLKAVFETGANVVGIFTADKQEMVRQSQMHPDYFSEFDDLAAERNVPLYKAKTVNSPLDIEKMRGLKPDIILCIGWPQIVGKEILQLARSGCVGIHPTLLPKRRGGAPINWCLIDGLNRSGVTLFYFDEGIDSGDIIAQQEFEITLEDTAKTVLSKVTNVAVGLVRNIYPLLERGEAPRIPQDHSIATYTRRRYPSDGIIDWNRTSSSLYNWIRAQTLPFPGAFTYWKGEKVTIWEAELPIGYKARFDTRPGEILGNYDGGALVATADYCLRIKTMEYRGENVPGDKLAEKTGMTPGKILGEVK
jgi:methionyl-tRNA formyltransferase